jgi:hypothetical protein
MKLVLELNKNFYPSDHALGVIAGGRIMVTPAIGEDFWQYRVRLNKKGQAIVGFPKFTLIGIGFAKETDWNTNLPSSCETEHIYNHIKHNKGDKNIKRADCIEAIKMIQAAVPVEKVDRHDIRKIVTRKLAKS